MKPALHRHDADVDALVQRICELDDEITANSARLDDDNIGSAENHAIIERNLELSKEFAEVYGRWLMLTQPTDRPN
jgi:hypothetical protein